MFARSPRSQLTHSNCTHGVVIDSSNYELRWKPIDSLTIADAKQLIYDALGARIDQTAHAYTVAIDKLIIHIGIIIANDWLKREDKTRRDDKKSLRAKHTQYYTSTSPRLSDVGCGRQ